MKIRSPLTCFAIIAIALLPLSAWAQHAYGYPHGGGYPGGHYYRPSPAYYGSHWHDGRWYHGYYGGSLGWWWTIDNNWYPYPAPIYPYPDPYAAPVVSLAAPGPAPQQFWYWCGNPAGYYPNVSQCSLPWQAVAAVATTNGAEPAQPPASQPTP